MQITYELREKDFIEAYGAHRDGGRFGKWADRLVLWPSLLFVVSILVGLIAHSEEQVARRYLPVPCVALFFILILNAWPRWAMKRLFRKQPGAQGPRTATFDHDGAHWRWDGGSADIAWKNYTRWVEGKNQILFYTSPAGFTILPKENLQPAQIEELRGLLKQNIRTAK